MYVNDIRHYSLLQSAYGFASKSRGQAVWNTLHFRMTRHIKDLVVPASGALLGSMDTV